MRSQVYILPLFALLVLAACSDSVTNGEDENEECRPTALPYHDVLVQNGAIRDVHDPVIMRHEDAYYLFSTGHGIPIRRSDDLISWQVAGRVFSADVPTWAEVRVPGVEFPWAPDIAFFNGTYHLYYSISTFGSQRSVIGLATNTTLDPADPAYAWIDQGLVIESRPGDAFNAIDPNVAYDADGTPWLSWGSYWGGIYLRRLNAETGLPPESDDTVHALAARPVESAIEAPFIIRHGGYYYLFASFDACCQGAESTYKIMVGRSETITGPYMDRDGQPMTQGGGTLVLKGYGRVRGPGHNAILTDGARHYLVHHFYDAEATNGTPTLQIRSLVWDAEGWPLAGYPYDNDYPDPDTEPNVVGSWGHSVDFAAPYQIDLLADGSVEVCNEGGTWSLDGSTLTIQWTAGGASGASQVEQFTVASDGTWYAGRTDDGIPIHGARAN